MLPIICPTHSKHDRAGMPQIKDMDAFLHWLTFQGVHWRKEVRLAKHFKPTQNQINLENVVALMRMGIDTKTFPILTSKEAKIADGHHRWYGEKIECTSVTAIVVDRNIKRLLILMAKFPQTSERETVEQGL